MLEELNFWRHFLSDGQPRISIDFGNGQRILVSTTLLSGEIVWPGIPDEYAKQFRNVEYAEDLFTLAQLSEQHKESEHDEMFEETDEEETGE